MDATEFFATAPKGMVDLLATELTQIGASQVSDARGGVRFKSGMDIAYRACLWSRIANRILMPLGNFPCDSPEALYDGVRNIEWEAHLGLQQTLAIDANLVDSKITHSHYAALKVKDAIVDRFVAISGSRPSVDTSTPDIRVNCYIHRDVASIYLDLSGTSLHQRHYRLAAGQAPLKENLAAAILLRSRWPEIAAGGGAFMDLMCGSGTLAIEAALLAADAAPGLTRDHFGFIGWRQHDAALWDSIVSEARGRRSVGMDRLPPILGFDSNQRVLDIARQNAQRAGFDGKITFEFQDIRNFQRSVPARGLMATNPPYGRRLAETGELPALYKALGQVLRENLRGWQAAVFTEDQSLGKHIGIRAGKLHALYNGAIACKLIHFTIEEANYFGDRHLPRGIRAEDLSAQAGMFRNRLEKNIRLIEKRAAREDVTCYRVYDADLPDFAAAIDVYHAVTNDEKWVCVQEYEAPDSIDARKARLRTRELITVTQAVFDLDDSHLFYKTRVRQRGERQYDRLDDTHQFHRVNEGACRLLVNFEDYLDTGLFLDHRPLRNRIHQQAAGKTFLNLFAYTGAATVHAAMAGASATTSVDMSRTYLEWCRRNLALNDQNTARNQLIHADCLKWLGEQKGAQYDLILLDPPTFSNSKRMDQALDVQRDHTELIRLAMGLLAKDGTLYFSTNARHFKFDDALALQYSVQDITDETIPFDFRQRRNVHRCWKVTANAES